MMRMGGFSARVMAFCGVPGLEIEGWGAGIRQIKSECGIFGRLYVTFNRETTARIWIEGDRLRGRLKSRTKGQGGPSGAEALPHFCAFTYGLNRLRKKAGLLSKEARMESSRG
jgi:hypothetical protein